MIPGYHDTWDPKAQHDPGECVVQQLNSLHRRCRPVVYISRNQHNIGALVTDYADELVKNVRLILGEMGFVEYPPKVPIGRMYQLYADRLPLRKRCWLPVRFLT